jgi:endonuclease G, mitochondrial
MSKISLLSGFPIFMAVFFYISFNSVAQVNYQEKDTVTICHKYYSTIFSKSKHFPVVVKYWLARSMLDCEHRYKRLNKFKPDPSILEYTNLNKDYKKSGYDRGHQMDAYDCGCDSTAMVESFYYSNVAPQLPTLNRGIWKQLEEYTRKLVKENDSILVWCGSVTIEERYIGKVAVPDYCWKIIYIKKSNVIKAYSFRNSDDLEACLHCFEVSIDSIQNMTGINFINIEIRTTK